MCEKITQIAGGNMLACSSKKYPHHSSEKVVRNTYEAKNHARVVLNLYFQIISNTSNPFEYLLRGNKKNDTNCYSVVSRNGITQFLKDFGRYHIFQTFQMLTISSFSFFV